NDVRNGETSGSPTRRSSKPSIFISLLLLCRCMFQDVADSALESDDPCAVVECGCECLPQVAAPLLGTLGIRDAERLDIVGNRDCHVAGWGRSWGRPRRQLR